MTVFVPSAKLQPNFGFKMKLSCRGHDHAVPFAYDLFRVTYLIWNHLQACTCVHMHTEDRKHPWLFIVAALRCSYNNRNPALGVLWSWPGPQDAQRRVAIIVTTLDDAMIFQAPSFAFTMFTTNYTVPWTITVENVVISEMCYAIQLKLTGQVK